MKHTVHKARWLNLIVKACLNTPAGVCIEKHCKALSDSNTKKYFEKEEEVLGFLLPCGTAEWGMLKVVFVVQCPPSPSSCLLLGLLRLNQHPPFYFHALGPDLQNCVYNKPILDIGPSFNPFILRRALWSQPGTRGSTWE